MKREVKALTFLYLLILLGITVFAFFDGVMKTIIYIIAYILPIFAGIYFFYKQKNKENAKLSGWFKTGAREARLAFMLFPSVILLILTSSFLASFFVFSIFGDTGNVTISEPAAIALIIHALIPALFEEGAFRLLPLLILGDKSPRLTVFLSAFFFALLHANLASIPYAFLAGVIFMALDLYTHSVVPSFVLHLLNNVTALFSLGVFGFAVEVPVLFALFGGFTILSLPFILKRRDEVISLFSAAFSRGEGYSLTAEPLLFAIPTIFIAVFEVIV